jgi:hypothetical protein
MRQLHTIRPVDAHAPSHHHPTEHRRLSATIISAKLGCHQVSTLAGAFFMLTIPCGMVKVVVQTALAAHSIIHHGSVDSYLSQLMQIWKCDYVQLMKQPSRILPYNWWRFTSSKSNN